MTEFNESISGPRANPFRPWIQLQILVDAGNLWAVMPANTVAFYRFEVFLPAFEGEAYRPIDRGLRELPWMRIGIEMIKMAVGTGLGATMLGANPGPTVELIISMRRVVVVAALFGVEHVKKRLIRSRINVRGPG